MGNRVFTAYREIKRGQEKGKLEIVINKYGQTKKLKILPCQVKKFPSE